jgi:Protein of unknown function (DUF3040)
MALSMDEQRMLAEIERRLADDDPVLAARLTAFRLPRLTFATRSARSRLVASLLMLVVVGVVSVFVYALIPFRSQDNSQLGGVHSTASPARPAMTTPDRANAATGSPGIHVRATSGADRAASDRSGPSSPAHHTR